MPSNSQEYIKKNLEKYWKNDKHRADNAKRKKARRMFEKKWLVKKFDGKEVDHKKWISAWNGNWNLRVLPMIANRILWQKKAMKNRVSTYNT